MIIFIEAQHSVLGTQLVILGGVGVEGNLPTATYSIDGQSPISQTPDVNADNVLINFASWRLSPTRHTVVANVTSDFGSTPTLPYVLDAILFRPIPNAVTAGLVVTQTSITGNVALRNQQQQHNVGKIVGGTIGGVALLFLILLAVLFFLRRRRGQYSFSGEAISN